jgi:hypothetical protein
LKELVLAPIASVRDRVRKVLRSVNLNDEPRISAQ